MNHLYFGDNLKVLRESIQDESIDLIYLDPPFNSKANYNILFKSPKGHDSDAQISAFDDTWHWGEQAEREYKEILHQGNTNVAEMMESLRRFLGENDMMAYLTMMANRLLELHRVLKPTGSIYLHCDPTASHYLKIVLDGVFGVRNFKNEITWKRKTGRGETNLKSNRFGITTDIILFYSKTDKNLFNSQFNSNAAGYQEYIDKFFRHIDEKGRRFRIDNLASPSPRPNLIYEYKGYPPPEKGWAISKDKMEQWDNEGRLYFPKNKSGRIQRKRYLDELKGKPVQNLWDDIEMISSHSAERLGYPTQKPVSLLERIIQASSNEDDTVLDPFCGCGTTVHAAQKLNRQWVGIDITHLAISLIEKRLNDSFPGIKYEVHGTPKDIGGAKDLAERDKYQFQWWACSLVNAQPYQGKKKGADGGIDGLIYFLDDKGKHKKIIVSVKGGSNVGVSMIRDLKAVVEREKAEIGLFVTLADPTQPMNTEALKAGYYTSPATKTDFNKIQILTIEGLLNGTQRADFPSEKSFGSHTFKKAKKEEQQTQEQLSFEDT
ncbi:MAG: DNA methyltransferase [Nitrospinota bacterium]|nr:DNA methyltransferase [Nitrospinota bacterium]